MSTTTEQRRESKKSKPDSAAFRGKKPRPPSPGNHGSKNKASARQQGRPRYFRKKESGAPAKNGTTALPEGVQVAYTSGKTLEKLSSRLKISPIVLTVDHPDKPEINGHVKSEGDCEEHSSTLHVQNGVSSEKKTTSGSAPAKMSSGVGEAGEVIKAAMTNGTSSGGVSTHKVTSSQRSSPDPDLGDATESSVITTPGSSLSTRPPGTVYVILSVPPGVGVDAESLLHAADQNGDVSMRNTQNSFTLTPVHLCHHRHVTTYGRNGWRGK